MASGWTITGDLPDQYSTAISATPVIGHVIQFQTASGNRGTVFIPDDHYTVAAVRSAVQVKADLTDEISKLAHHV